MLVAKILIAAELISIGFGIAVFLGVNLNPLLNPIMNNATIQPLVGLAIVFLAALGLVVHLRLMREEEDDG